ncbi:hypothetical protein [Catellatospora sp. NPDC049609]|uniref:hypothetical protein n=1 Tax=Catellatospora sp. NPDC049609 TaxID=3155505 RepID=UPI0034214FC0
MSSLRFALPRESLGEVQRAIAWTGLVSALAAVTLALTPVPSAVAFLALVAFACVGPGAACVCHVRLGDPVAAWAVVLVLSMSLSVLTSVTLVWARWWEPVVGLIVLATLSAASCAVALVLKDQQGPPPEPGPVLPGQRPGSTGAVTPAASETALFPVIGGRRGADEALLLAVGAEVTQRLPDETTLLPIIGGPAAPRPAATDETSVIPRIGGPAAPDETSVIPRIGGPAAPDETSVIPRIGGPAVPADQTTVIPRVTSRIPAAPQDATGLLPRVAGPGPDATSLIPRITAPAAEAAAEPPHQDAAPRRLSARQRRSRRRWETAAALGTILSAVVVWAFSVAGTRIDDVDDFGLLSAVHPAYFLAIVICVLGFVTELARRRPRGWAALGNTAALLLIMHATVPILVAEPEYSWTYKHLGVIDLIAVGRPLDNAYDVYQQWPAFFALVAQLTTAAGTTALDVASWAPLFFGLINLLPVYAIARTLSTDRRVPHLTAFVFCAVNWVGQDYLAPQAFAYTLSLGVVLVMLRWLRRDPMPSREQHRLLTRLWTWVQVGVGPVPYTSSRARKLSLVTLYLVYAAIVVSHQLSPYLVAVGAFALVAFRLVQPVQIVPIFGVIAVLQVIPRYRLVESWGLFDGFNLFANAQPTGPTQGMVSSGRTFSVLAVEVLALAVWLTAAIVVVANRKRLGPLAVPAALAAGPFAVLLGNSYGGEAVFRVFLFSSPWCAFLIAVGMLRLRLDRRLGIGLAAPALALAAVVAVQGEHGQLMVNRFTTAEVRAAQYLYANIPTGGAVVLAGVNFPDRIGARYTDVLGAVGATDSIMPDVSYEGAVIFGEAMDDSDLAALNSYFDVYTVPVYLVFSRSQANAAAYFGYYPPGKLEQLRGLVAGSAQWRLWHGNEDTQIYQYVPGPAAPTTEADAPVPQP